MLIRVISTDQRHRSFFAMLLYRLSLEVTTTLSSEFCVNTLTIADSDPGISPFEWEGQGNVAHLIASASQPPSSSAVTGSFGLPLVCT